MHSRSGSGSQAAAVTRDPSHRPAVPSSPRFGSFGTGGTPAQYRAGRLAGDWFSRRRRPAPCPWQEIGPGREPSGRHLVGDVLAVVQLHVRVILVPRLRRAAARAVAAGVRPAAAAWHLSAPRCERGVRSEPPSALRCASPPPRSLALRACARGAGDRAHHGPLAEALGRAPDHRWLAVVGPRRRAAHRREEGVGDGSRNERAAACQRN